VYCDCGYWSKAIEELTEAIRIDQHCAIAYVNRAYAFGESKQFEKALTDTASAIGLVDSIIVAYTNRGRYYLEIGEGSKARDDFKRATELTEEGAGAVKGFALASLGEFDRAIKECEIGIAQDEHDRWGYWCLAAVYCMRAKSHGQDEMGILALSQDLQAAIKSLDTGFTKGLDRWAGLTQVSELRILHEHADFQKLIQRQKIMTFK
jgi:tetratricopeptide (TPR) repeat protein